MFNSLTSRVKYVISCFDCIQSSVWTKFIFIKHVCELCPRVIVSLTCTDVPTILAYANTLHSSQFSHLARDFSHSKSPTIYTSNTRADNL